MRIVSFVLAAMLVVLSYMPVLDVQAELETVGKGILIYEAEVIWKDFAEGVQYGAQSDVTEDIDMNWDCYSVGGPVREYET